MLVPDPQILQSQPKLFVGRASRSCEDCRSCFASRGITWTSCVRFCKLTRRLHAARLVARLSRTCQEVGQLSFAWHAAAAVAQFHQIVIFEKNTFLVISHALTKSIQDWGWEDCNACRSPAAKVARRSEPSPRLKFRDECAWQPSCTRTATASRSCPTSSSSLKATLVIVTPRRKSVFTTSLYVHILTQTGTGVVSLSLSLAMCVASCACSLWQFYICESRHMDP